MHQPPPDLIPWVAAAQNGDLAARDRVIAAILPGMEAYVRLNTGPLIAAKESSADLVQSICREVLEGLDGFRGESAAQFKGWLFQLALHKIVKRHRFLTAQRRDVRRERDVHAPATTNAEDLLTCYGTFCTPSRDVSAREELARIEAAMQELPEAQRQVMTLAHVAGMSHQEIARELGKEEPAVRKLHSRARARLLLLLALDEEAAG